MRCAKCGTEGISGKKFCAECGNPLPNRCSNCNSDNAPDAKFCADCGASLSAPLSTEPHFTGDDQGPNPNYDVEPGFPATFPTWRSIASFAFCAETATGRWGLHKITKIKQRIGAYYQRILGAVPTVP